MAVGHERLSVFQYRCPRWVGTIRWESCYVNSEVGPTVLGPTVQCLDQTLNLNKIQPLDHAVRMPTDRLLQCTLDSEVDVNSQRGQGDTTLKC